MEQHPLQASQPHSPQRRFWTSKAFLVFIGFAAIAVALLWQEHRAHILGLIPYLLLLACPLMHVFMHRGHGKHDHNRHSGANSDDRDGGRS
jgi:Protein of unknown function (DUF2933)